MADFARRTALSPAEDEPQRYLWTDAFAVCNYLALHRRTGSQGSLELALRLADQVHHRLGRHRADDQRSGWISGLSEEEGAQHPTIGGLRIGKPLNERGPEERLDQQLEWERDGQYYHYLTKWMHALHQLGLATAAPAFHRWARELAMTAQARFTHTAPGGRRRLYWKMSIDLSRPLVPSMGQHDPLDGLVTLAELALTDSGSATDLEPAIVELKEMNRGQSLATDDPLGLGGLLFDAARIAQLTALGASLPNRLLADVLAAVLAGLEAFSGSHALHLPVAYRLAFRELGLAIGLRAVTLLDELLAERPKSFDPGLRPLVESMGPYASLGEEITDFWLQEANQAADSWREHLEINTVMLATSLVPEGVLRIASL